MVVTDQNEDVEQDELKIFVSSTLKAIMAGIADAQTDARAMSAHGKLEYGFSPPNNVAFDVAVHATRTGKIGGGFKVQVFSVGANAETSGSREDATVSRITFTIPTSRKQIN